MIPGVAVLRLHAGMQGDCGLIHVILQGVGHACSYSFTGLGPMSVLVMSVQVNTSATVGKAKVYGIEGWMFAGWVRGNGAAQYMHLAACCYGPA